METQIENQIKNMSIFDIEDPYKDQIEEFIILPNLSRYKISNKGHVYNIKEKKYMKEVINKGYKRVELTLDNAEINTDGNMTNRRNKVVHRLVALAFIPNPEKKPNVDHINRKRWDNNILNLRWSTPLENAENRSKRDDVSSIYYGVVKFEDTGKYYINKEYTYFDENNDEHKDRLVFKQFDDEITAAKYYDSQIKIVNEKYKKDFPLNFIDDKLNPDLENKSARTEKIIKYVDTTLEYKIHEDFPNYKIYIDGQVGNEFDISIGHTRDDGYREVNLVNGNKTLQIRIHVLVAKLFIGEKPSSKHYVDHKNRKRWDNNVENLEWKTPAQNNINKNKYKEIQQNKTNDEIIDGKCQGVNKAGPSWRLKFQITDKITKIKFKYDKCHKDKYYAVFLYDRFMYHYGKNTHSLNLNYPEIEFDENGKKIIYHKDISDEELEEYGMEDKKTDCKTFAKYTKNMDGEIEFIKKIGKLFLEIPIDDWYDLHIFESNEYFIIF